jgi:tetratricopeptide (TPR) repeat protein
VESAFAVAALRVCAAARTRVFTGTWPWYPYGVRSAETPTPPAAPSPAADALHVPGSTHRRLRWAGPALIVAGVAVALIRPGAALAWALLAAGAALAWVVTRTTTPDRGCAFCGAGREQVPFLVTGAAVSLCPECAVAASARTAEELDRRGEHAEWNRLFVAGLPERASRALSRPYVEALVGSDRSPEHARDAVACCLRFGHHRLAQELLESLPEPERRPLDWINLGFALGEQGRFADAIAATRRAGTGEGSAEAPWILANTAWYELQLRPDAARDDLARWLAQTVEARRTLAARRPPGTGGDEASRHAVASFRGIEAELLRRGGDAAGALGALDAADAEAPTTGERLVLRARALADLGRAAEARADAELALGLLRGDAREAGDARRLLESLPRDGGSAA